MNINNRYDIVKGRIIDALEALESLEGASVWRSHEKRQIVICRNSRDLWRGNLKQAEALADMLEAMVAEKAAKA